MKSFHIQDHVVVIGGDTLFKEDFSLREVMGKISELGDGGLVLGYECSDEETQKYGILEVNQNLRVVCMKEKPQPSETESRTACPCFYVLSKECLPLLDAFLQEKQVSFYLSDTPHPSGVQLLIPSRPIRTLRSKPETLRGTLCRGSFPGIRGSDPERALRSPRLTFIHTCCFVSRQEAGSPAPDLRALRRGEPAVLPGVRPLL